MRTFLAGGSGVLGTRVIPLLVAEGHVVTATTRSEAKLDDLRRLGATAVCCDVLDAEHLLEVVLAAAPEAVIHHLTDLPDDRARIPEFRHATARVRVDGTDNLLAAARGSAGAERLVAQSIAWLVDGVQPASVEHLEAATLVAGGVVLRFGQWYGPGTYHPDEPPPPPRAHLDVVARATVDALTLPTGTYVVTDDGTELAEP